MKVNVNFERDIVTLDGVNFRLGILQYALGMARHVFFHPAKDTGQWISPTPRPAVFGESFSEFARLGLLLRRDVPSVGEVYQITSIGFMVFGKVFPKERWYKWLSRSIACWLWYKPKFFLKYGIWP